MTSSRKVEKHEIVNKYVKTCTQHAKFVNLRHYLLLLHCLVFIVDIVPYFVSMQLMYCKDSFRHRQCENDVLLYSFSVFDSCTQLNLISFHATYILCSLFDVYEIT